MGHAPPLDHIFQFIQSRAHNFPLYWLKVAGGSRPSYDLELKLGAARRRPSPRSRAVRRPWWRWPSRNTAMPRHPPPVARSARLEASPHSRDGSLAVVTGGSVSILRVVAWRSEASSS